MKTYLLSQVLLLLLLAMIIEDNVEDEDAGRLLGDVLSIVLAEQPILPEFEQVFTKIFSVSHIFITSLV